jgi:hypothetical protein
MWTQKCVVQNASVDVNISNTLTPHGKKMHVKEIYVIFIHLFDSGILLIIDLNNKKGKKGEFYL